MRESRPVINHKKTRSRVNGAHSSSIFSTTVGPCCQRMSRSMTGSVEHGWIARPWTGCVTLPSYETDRHLEGTIEADERSHTAGNKGQAKHAGKKLLGRRARRRRKKREPGRGRYDNDQP